MGGYGFMGRGLVYSVKIFFIGLIFLLGCSTVNVQDHVGTISDEIGILQSQLVTLTVECEEGDKVSCDKVPKYKEKLNLLIRYKSIK